MDTALKIVVGIAVVGLVIAAIAGLIAAADIALALTELYDAATVMLVNRWEPMKFIGGWFGYGQVLVALVGVVVGRILAVGAAKVVLRVLSL